jgi:hypothetical protein
MPEQGWTSPQDVIHENMTRIDEGIVKTRYLENSAMVIVVVQRLDRWSGTVMRSDNFQTTLDGCNKGYFSIPRSVFFGSYSLAMQRSNDGDGLHYHSNRLCNLLPRFNEKKKSNTVFTVFSIFLPGSLQDILNISSEFI